MSLTNHNTCYIIIYYVLFFNIFANPYICKQRCYIYRTYQYECKGKNIAIPQSITGVGAKNAAGYKPIITTDIYLNVFQWGDPAGSVLVMLDTKNKWINWQNLSHIKWHSER